MFTSLRVQGYRSFVDSGNLPLSPLTILVGRNNSGKSTLLRAVYQLQEAAPWADDDVRVDASRALIQLTFDELGAPPFPTAVRDAKWRGGQLNISRHRANAAQVDLTNPSHGDDSLRLTVLPAKEPENLIYPSLARRYGNTQYEEQVRKDTITAIWPTDTNLVARASTVLNTRTREGREFQSLCERVLQQTVDLMTSDNGQRLGVQLDRWRQVGLPSMGTGIGTVLGLLVNLTGAHGKVFLIEEPENDLHPQALKALLDVIIEKSDTNQFIISTHSNIVLTRLGALATATVLHTDMTVQDDIPTSTVRTVADRQGRLGVLRDLGYALADLDLAEGWLIFEESSAERICRQYLIPWFVPELGRLTTVAAAGTSRIGPLWQNLREMALYAHRQPQYVDRLWAIADGDPEGTKAVRELAARFDKDGRGKFHTWSRPDFEAYYPTPFASRAEEVRALPHDHRPEPKRQLLLDVLSWIGEDERRAREEFECSANEAVATLRLIGDQVRNMGS